MPNTTYDIKISDHLCLKEHHTCEYCELYVFEDIDGHPIYMSPNTLNETIANLIKVRDMTRDEAREKRQT